MVLELTLRRFEQSAVRSLIGAIPDIKSAKQTCYRCNVKVDDIKRLGLVEWAADPGIQVRSSPSVRIALC